MSATTTRRKPQRRAATRPDGPSKSEQNAEAALAAVLALFESGDLPERVAQTLIARQATDAPIGSWSLGNALLAILAGTADARGFRQWQEAGRNVKKGSRAFHILGPKARKIRETDTATGEETSRTIITGFVGIPVFRYEDTEGEPLEHPDYTPPETPPLMDAAERLGVSVTYAPHVARAGFRGYFDPNGAGAIVLLTHDERTWFHELGHAAHARVLRDRGQSMRGGQIASQEIVAETVAAVLCRLHGADGFLAHSRDYISGYAKGKSPARAAMRVLADVQATLDVILNPEPAPAAAPVPVAVAA